MILWYIMYLHIMCIQWTMGGRDPLYTLIIMYNVYVHVYIRVCQIRSVSVVFVKH